MPSFGSIARGALAFAALLVPLALGVSCARERGEERAAQPLLCEEPASAPLQAPPEPDCDNPMLESHEALLVVVPHPDDEVVGFAGLIDTYVSQGKPVEVVVVTDGDAYCEACRFWKSASVTGPPCDTEELAAFSAVRREESRAGLALLGVSEPDLLGYPDLGIRVAWNATRLSDPGRPLRRSDFSQCEDCETCTVGYLQGPESGLLAESLVAELRSRLADAASGTLVATTHWLDRHSDHAALGNFVKTLNDELDPPHTVAYAVIHARTDQGLSFPECWYPGPSAVQCLCAEERCAEADPSWLSRLRAHRYRPHWPAELPGDAPYGTARTLCLREELFSGEDPLKLAAVETHASQLGFATRSGTVPAHLRGIVDCSGYLTSFVRRSEVFVLEEPAGPALACDPTGAWEGAKVTRSTEGRESWTPARLTVETLEAGSIRAILTWEDRQAGAQTLELSGALDGTCGLELAGTGKESQRIAATLSADRRSLYGSWREPSRGFLTVHR